MDRREFLETTSVGAMACTIDRPAADRCVSAGTGPAVRVVVVGDSTVASYPPGRDTARSTPPASGHAYRGLSG